MTIMMFDQKSSCRELICLFLSLIPNEGHYSTPIDGIDLMRVNDHSIPVAVLQEPTLVFVLQGLKRGYLGEQIYEFKAGQCLIVSTFLAFDCDSVASLEQPMFALSMRLEKNLVHTLLGQTTFEDHQSLTGIRSGMAVVDIDEKVSNVLHRILETLASKQDTLILGSQLKRELLYRILQTAGGEVIKEVIANPRFSAIYTLCEYLQVHYREPCTVEQLAHHVGMSLSIFHIYFKNVTQHSPLQYIKNIRLHKAKQLIELNQFSLVEVAQSVGYVSASQFSREYKKFFGFSPKNTLRKIL